MHLQKHSDFHRVTKTRRLPKQNVTSINFTCTISTHNDGRVPVTVPLPDLCTAEHMHDIRDVTSYSECMHYSDLALSLSRRNVTVTSCVDKRQSASIGAMKWPGPLCSPLNIGFCCLGLSTVMVDWLLNSIFDQRIFSSLGVKFGKFRPCTMVNGFSSLQYPTKHKNVVTPLIPTVSSPNFYHRCI
jgi:hypothetical protein